ncbi:YceI family protein [Palleronia sp. LCG004]|uniref:YceI family protein n=1 Tax=Palleronia sp. LCG004 TaxID=3079304 RepID=UPI0029430180|nr:YceI family protein [Palleronia sp. LCG004]WOI57295.1 YceI family protein [Palleronia sp. LCG004]
MRIASLSLLLATAPLVLKAEPARFELDPAHTTVVFLVDHMGYAATLGLFAEVEGGFVYDEETQELSAVRVVVQTVSIDTKNDARDEHVRSDDFLDVSEFSEMVFTADEGVPDDEMTGKVEGSLELRGETRPLTLEVTLNKAEEYPFGHGRYTLGLSLRGALSRSEWGMDYGVADGLVGDEVRLLIETEAMRVSD